VTDASRTGAGATDTDSAVLTEMNLPGTEDHAKVVELLEPNGSAWSPETKYFNT